MARKVFFSFHYDNDVTRANVVRNSWITKPDRATAGFIDHAEFEQLKRRGEQAVRSWIDDQLAGSSITVVLIGSETLNRPFVKYELEQSYKRGNAIVGIYINSIKDFNQQASARCTTTGHQIGKDTNGKAVFFTYFPIYDWVTDNGYANLGTWVESAAASQRK